MEIHPGVTSLVGHQATVPTYIGLSAQPQGDQPRARGTHTASDKIKGHYHEEYYHNDYDLTA